MKAKFYYLFALIFLLSPSWLFGQCGVVTLNGQAEIDQFAINYPGCTQLDSLIIRYGSNGESVNLDGLVSIQSISFLKIKDLMVQDDLIATINCDGLSQITSLESLDLLVQAGSGLNGVVSIGQADISIFSDFNGLDAYSEGESIVFHAGHHTDPSVWDLFDLFGSANSIIELNLSEYAGDVINGFPSLTNAQWISVGSTNSLMPSSVSLFNNLVQCDNIDIAGDFAQADCYWFNSLTDANYINVQTILSQGELFASLETAPEIHVSHAVGYFSTTALNIFPSLAHAGWLEVNNELNISFPSLQSVDDLHMNQMNGGLIGPQFPALVNVNTLFINALTETPSIHFPALTTINQTLQIEGNTIFPGWTPPNGVPTLSFPELNYIGGLLAMMYTDFESLETFSNLSNLSNVVLQYNYALNSCEVSAVCQLLMQLPGQNTNALIEINDNGPNCDAAEDFMSACQGSYISGLAFKDYNCNGVLDANEDLVDYPIVLDQTGNVLGWSFQNGEFLIPAQLSSTYIFDVNSPVGFLPSVANEVVTESSPNSYPINIAFCPDDNYIDLGVQLYNFTNFRPGFDQFFSIQVENNSSSLQEVDLTLTDVNEIWWDYVQSSIPATLGNNSLVFDSFILPAFADSIITLRLHLSNAVSIGQLITIHGNLEGGATTENDYSNNAFSLSAIVVGSFDPNDMMVNRPAINYELASEGDWLTYRIRFQNTGTAPAQFIRVVSEQSDLLDLSTFDMLETSHSAELSFDGREVTWFFDNIQLPDSTTDLEGSQGYIFYRIRMNEGVTIDDVIANHAAIYFDFNEPVITNEATTVFYTCPTIPTITQSGNTLTASGSGDFTWYYNGELLPDTDASIDMQATGNYQVSVSNEYCTSPFAEGNFTFVGVENLSAHQLVLFPNPTSDYFIISGNQGHYDEVLIYSSMGELVMKTSWKQNAMIDVKGLPIGVYTVQLISRSSEKTEHFSVMKK